MDSERDTWNRRYREGSHASREPDPLLLHAYENFIAPLFPDAGRALELAGGVGRHAIWMAEHGWQVTLSDISEVAIERARQSAGKLETRIEFRVQDLTTSHCGSGAYDVALVFFYLDRDIFSKLVDSLRPGGLLIYKTYTHMAPMLGKGPTHPMHLLQENELLRAFAGMTVLHYEETIRGRAIAELVARKGR